MGNINFINPAIVGALCSLAIHAGHVDENIQPDPGTEIIQFKKLPPPQPMYNIHRIDPVPETNCRLATLAELL